MDNLIKKDMTSITVLAKANVDAIRVEFLDNVKHLVVPIVALVEGVLQGVNSPTPELALADVFGQFPQAWNGRPVTFDHPVVNGINVSASDSPMVFEEESIGFLFNSKVEDKKLKTEAWLNMDKINSNSSDNTPNPDRRVKDRRINDPEHNNGHLKRRKDKRRKNMQSNAVKTHNIDRQNEIHRLLSGEMVEVSTGLFANIDMKDGVFNGEQFGGVWSSIMPDHLAILPSGTTGACSVADGCGAPRLNKNKELKMIEKTDEQIKSNESNDSLFSQLRDTFDGIFKTNSETRDTQSSLLTCLKAENADKSYDIVAIFDDDFIFSEDNSNVLKTRTFSISENGGTTLGNEAIEVRPVTEFVPIVKIEEYSMKEENTKIDELIANAATQFSEKDKEWLSSLSDENLSKLVPLEAKADEAKADKEEDIKSHEEVEVIANKADTVESFISTAPAEMQEVLNAGIKMHREEKSCLISELKSNERCVFSEKELTSMTLDNLEKLSKLGNLPSYEGQAGNINANAGVKEDQTPDAPKVFDFKK